MEATLWPRGGGVICHDTALDVHGLCDINPAKIHITVRKDMRITRRIPALYRLHYRDLEEHETTWHEGHPPSSPRHGRYAMASRHTGART
jgi:predicted transcriptional regulator of viral defense system